MSTRAQKRSRISRAGRAFTLLEIMIVVGIMGIIMTMGVPIVYRAWNKAPMAKAVSEVVEVCAFARTQAIMQGREVHLYIYPDRLSVGAAPDPRSAPLPDNSAAGVPAGVASVVPMSGSGSSATLPDSVAISQLNINNMRQDFMQAESVRIRFFPNGTCDELTLILVSEKGERCQIQLEVTTALAEVEWDQLKFR